MGWDMRVSGDTSRSAVIAVWAVLLLVLAARAVAIVDARDPGFDQAMLMASFPLDGLSGYLRPLPLYEQATPLGSVAMLDAVSRLFGDIGLDRFTAARVLAAAFALAGYLLLFGFLRRGFGAGTAALAVALIAAPQETLLFTTNPKHYVQEFFAACLMLRLAADWLDRPDTGRSLRFLAGTLVTCLLAFTAPLILCAVGGGMLVATLAGTGGTRHPGTLARLLGIGSAALAIAVVFHLAITLPATAFQSAAYADRYGSTLLRPWEGLSEHNIRVLRGIAAALYQMVEPSYTVEILARTGLIGWRNGLAIAALALAVIGFPALWRGSKLLAGGLALGLLAFLALNMLQALPILSMRHFLFFTPFFGPCVALGIVTLLGWISRAVRLPGLVGPATLALALGIAGLAVLKSSDLENNEISDHLALVDRDPAKLWIYYGAQPGVRALRRDLLEDPGREILGLLPDASTPVSWTRAARDENNRLTGAQYFEQAARDLAGTDPVWLVFAHSWPERHTPDGLERFVAMAEADGRICRRHTAPGGLLLYCALSDAFPPALEGVLR